MGEEQEQKIYWKPIPFEELIPFEEQIPVLDLGTDDLEIKEIPFTETKHDNGLSSFLAQISVRVKRLSVGWFKLPRKKKKRLKTHFSHILGIPTKHIRINAII